MSDSLIAAAASTNNAAAGMRRASEIDTPECNKLVAVSKKSQVIGEFLEWLTVERRIHLAAFHEHDYNECWRDDEFTCDLSDNVLYGASLGIEKILADYFDIDMEKVEKERRAILEALR